MHARPIDYQRGVSKSGRGPNGTRSNLQNSSTRFHCSLIIGSLAPSGRPTGPVVALGLDVAAGAWFESSTVGL